MEGVIVNFKRGKNVQADNQMIVKIAGYEDKNKAKDLVGRKVTWKSPAGKEINGEVRNFHGNSGAVRVMFEKGMPGQAIGTKVSVQ